MAMAGIKRMTDLIVEFGAMRGKTTTNDSFTLLDRFWIPRFDLTC